MSKLVYGVGVNDKTEIMGGKTTKPQSKIVRDKKYPKNLLTFSNASQKGKVHPTQKPVALMEYLIKTYTQEGETVLDFTMGSGTTGVACTNTNRKFIGIERDDKYFDISVKRIKRISQVSCSIEPTILPFNFIS